MQQNNIGAQASITLAKETSATYVWWNMFTQVGLTETCL